MTPHSSLHEPVASPQSGWALRALDAALALLALTVLAFPLVLACGLSSGPSQRLWVHGANGRTFAYRQLGFASNGVGRWLNALKAPRWLEPWYVLRGHMSWVGPRTQPTQAPWHKGLEQAQPGVFNSWLVRKRTAVLMGNELEADLDDWKRRAVRHRLGLLLRVATVALLPRGVGLAAAPTKIKVGTVTIDNLDAAAALAYLEHMLDYGRGELVCFVNAACVNIASKEPNYRKALSAATLTLADGIGVKLAADLLGTPLRCNLNGTDLFPVLLQRLADKRGRVFLLGGSSVVVHGVADVIATRWPEVTVAGVRNGYFTLQEEPQLVADIRASGSDLLLVARGVPTQELFLMRHQQALGVKMALGVGGLFDFVSGRIPRAPQWLRDVGGEWTYRLLQEPGRMWRRYLIGNLTFMVRIMVQRWSASKAGGDSTEGRPLGEGTPASLRDPLAGHINRSDF